MTCCIKSLSVLFVNKITPQKIYAHHRIKMKNQYTITLIERSSFEKSVNN